MAKDYYKILGVEKNASADEIKKSFRRLAHEHHPDKGGDQQKFKDVNEAYQVLGDEKKRTQYDRFGSAAFEQGGMGGGGFGGFGGFDPSGININMEDMGDLGDILGGMFGFGGRGRGQKRGADIQVDVTLDFLDMVTGVDKKVKLYSHTECSKCHGSGAEPGAQLSECKNCSGKGRVTRAQRTVFGMVQAETVCPECHGTGKIPDKVCTQCKGHGVERRQRELELHIPAGINEGETLRVAGEGENPGRGGQPGDLYVRVGISRHPVFSREGNDVLSTVEIPFSTLALGGSVDIKSVDGDGSLKIPEGTRPETVFKLRGKGIPFMRSHGRGDHLVTVVPIVPKKLDKEQRRAIENLREAGL
jgi:molecular chaperone DnaJ